ncbi:unnamed protein product [Gongylonema pulchrum]|uniref:Glycosyltransferase 2-like domain-containing protein n=1 Tax=Gongylonema pulchrum TaxID=637853 RepID=A0A3P6RG12_9BILA|nr:unnamed protein product [Gongylonema pulchrum]
MTSNETDEFESEAKRRRYEWGTAKFAFDVLASDKIGPRRNLPPAHHHLCESVPWAIKLRASIVIIYHNEALSVLIRMLNSIFDRTPSHLIEEIILYDDCSDYDTLLVNHINSYGKHVQWPMQKIVTRRSEQRLGLIKAKVRLRIMRDNQFITFLDDPRFRYKLAP